MSKFANSLKSFPDFVSLKGASVEQISQAEDELKAIFAKDFSDYMLEFGAASADGHEFTGLCKSARLNVVDVTLREREENPEVPEGWYVIEEANIDGIVIWQNAEGEIYMTSPYSEPGKIANSLFEYILL